jgi:hypothetical protein
MIAQTARAVARKGEDGRVRLEADASGGELGVRATVVGDDGRAQSFRRLVVHVAGPDGMARELALEATGAGAYAATLPLSRPGTYIAVARDELTGDAVGTTGAVLSAGEELRPTGSDPALLGRIADLTGGKRRDTLAGIFADRASRRFAYQDATPPLLVLAAFGLLLAVAARRLSMPDALVAWAARRRSARAQGQPAVEKAQAAETTLGALIDARDRSARDRDARAREEAEKKPEPPRPPPVATAPRPVAAAQASQAAKPAAPPLPPPPGPPPTAGGRPLSSAEILLARRKAKGP